MEALVVENQNDQINVSLSIQFHSFGDVMRVT